MRLTKVIYLLKQGGKEKLHGLFKEHLTYKTDYNVFEYKITYKANALAWYCISNLIKHDYL